MNDSCKYVYWANLITHNGKGCNEVIRTYMHTSLSIDIAPCLSSTGCIHVHGNATFMVTYCMAPMNRGVMNE